MGISCHQLSVEQLGALGTGGGGPETIDLLRQSQYSKHVLMLHAIATASPAAAAAYDLLARVQREDAPAASAVVRYPAVGAWAYRTTLALRGGPQLPGAASEGLSAVAAAAASRAALAAEIDVPARDGFVMLPSLGAVEAPGAKMATVHITPDGIQVRAKGRCVTIPPDYRAVPGWRPLRPMLAGIVMDEIDPFRMPAAPHLGSAPDHSRWRSAFADAWTLLHQHHPAVAAEVAAVITAVVPLAKPPDGQVSSSSPEAFGAVAMSEPPDPVDVALTLAHETQHMKLSAVLDLVRLIRPDNGSRYYAPWREDPRPAAGLLQGAYAFLGVTAFWRRQRDVTAASDSLAEVEFARWRDAAALACETLLVSGQLTEDGEIFVATMAETLRPWRDEPVADEAQRLADEENERHAARWTAQHGPVTVSR
jgi:uncharacterized protein